MPDTSETPLESESEAPAAVEVFRGGAFRSRPGLFAQLAAVAAPSYQDPTTLLQRDWARCDTLYLARDANGVSGFYLVGYEELDVGGRILPALFLGMSAARQDRKNSGGVSRLYARGLADAMRWEEEHGHRLVFWGTTASPSVYLAARAGFARLDPRPDAGYSPDSVTGAAAVRRTLALPTAGDASGHPFVLRGAARDTRYSDQERERIARVCRAKRFTLFDDLGIDEARQDRLLFLGDAPAGMAAASPVARRQATSAAVEGGR